MTLSPSASTGGSLVYFHERRHDVRYGYANLLVQQESFASIRRLRPEHGTGLRSDQDFALFLAASVVAQVE